MNGGKISETTWMAYGGDLDAYARRLLISNLLFGHAATLVDYPSTEPAPNLLVEREMGLRPYFIQVEAASILGWRKEDTSPISPITQIRINEYVSEDVGRFGIEGGRQVGSLSRVSWEVWRKGDDGWYVAENGTTSMDYIPFSVVYSEKVSELISKPPLLPIANLNIQHAQRSGGSKP